MRKRRWKFSMRSITNSWPTSKASLRRSKPALRSDVTREVEMLEDASSCLRQAHQWASDKADELTTRLREGQESSQRKGLFRRAPANSVIDLEEEQADSFASGVNFYKVALICIAGSFAGVVVEILWCLFRNGYIESRSGLVYGSLQPCLRYRRSGDDPGHVPLSQPQLLHLLFRRSCGGQCH